MAKLALDTSNVLEATLDALGYPALITDESGNPQAANSLARYLIDHGMSTGRELRDAQSRSAEQDLAVGGMNFRCMSRPFGRDTHLVLHELHRTDDTCRGLREATQRLAARLEARTY